VLSSEKTEGVGNAFLVELTLVAVEPVAPSQVKGESSERIPRSVA
jgi:hypothetical protein